MCFLGTVLALLTFMADALRVARQGVSAIHEVLPAEFNWWMFLLALALMSAPLAQELWWLRPRRETAIEGARTN